MLGNIDKEDFDPNKDMVNYDEMNSFDKYFMIRLNEVNKAVREAYGRYDFIAVSSLLTNFMSNELSAYYLDCAKDVLYIEKLDSHKRRSCQSVIYHATDTLVRLWSPILCFTADEVWNHFNNDEATSVHYTHFIDETFYAD